MTTQPSRLSKVTNLGDVLATTPQNASRPAVIDLRGPEPTTTTYGELDRLAGGVAEHLLARGLRAGERVGIVALNRTEYLAAYLGTMRAGLVAVPLSHKFPANVLDVIVRDAELRLVFVDDSGRTLVPDGVPVIDFDDPGDEGFAKVVRPADVPGIDPEPGAIAEMLYTSGSTGIPKGVPLSHAGQLWALDLLAVPSADGEPETTIIAQPLFHMNGIVVSSASLLLGDTIVLQPRFRTEDYVRAIRDYQVSKVSAVPTMWSRAVQEALAGRADLSSVRSLSLGSAPTSSELLTATCRLLPDVRLSLSYGTTEAGPAMFGAHPDGRPSPDGAMGYPLSGVELRLEGGDRDQGVLFTRTPAVMDAYHHLPERSAEVLDDGWYNTRDIVRRDEAGFYYFVGRADDMFVCGGENIYPGEVEALLENHPDIHQAVVVPLPDADRGEVPVAFVVPRVGSELTAADVKAYALANGAPHLHPRRVAFRTELPLAGTNKVDVKQLLATAEQLEADQGWAP
ncbi:class I adenylate-forming enzyme family protein [Nocardioides sp. LHG3406-4]|uniref:class I adenylate-forming enzyme family protein n=1 Tax=Nocardioides sp. LHG3406-4 TaxID=2804575 RepID=UPI003CE78872